MNDLWNPDTLNHVFVLALAQTDRTTAEQRALVQLAAWLDRVGPDNDHLAQAIETWDMGGDLPAGRAEEMCREWASVERGLWAGTED